MFQRLASRLLSKPQLIQRVIFRNHWNKDYKPAPFPKTHEERMIAARKYGIPIDEYEPYNNDVQPYGDYPKLPMISNSARSEYYPWDFPEVKRNYGEPIHTEFDLLMDERYDYSTRLRSSLTVLLLQFLAGVGSAAFLFYIFEYCKAFTGIIPKQFPYKGEVHYLFEMYSGDLEEIKLDGESDADAEEDTEGTDDATAVVVRKKRPILCPK